MKDILLTGVAAVLLSTTAQAEMQKRVGRISVA